jgi:hypothetical protein
MEIAFGKTTIIDRIQQIGFTDSVFATNSYNRQIKMIRTQGMIFEAG